MQVQWLEGGKRLRLQHGPIDLILCAEGETLSVARAYRYARDEFPGILNDLVSELPILRKAIAEPDTRSATESAREPCGAVAKRMFSAASLYKGFSYVTPMIAVAGAVADYLLDVMLTVPSLKRVYINNGGDIALWLSPDQSFSIGICENTQTQKIGANFIIKPHHGIQGVATSGWRGRSHSLGIADAVTVLARCAADADAAATIIANAVDVPGSQRIHRLAADSLLPESDLGERLVTVDVDQLTAAEIRLALERGRSQASGLLSMQLISAAFISLAGSSIVCDKTSSRLRAGAMHA